jgi:hypothetical protein
LQQQLPKKYSDKAVSFHVWFAPTIRKSIAIGKIAQIIFPLSINKQMDQN